MKQEHGHPEQLNGYVLDVDDECTGYGAHKVCTVCGELDGSAIEVTASDKDHVGHLPWPSEAQARKVALGSRRVHERGRLVFDSLSRWYHNGIDRQTFRFRVI